MGYAQPSGFSNDAGVILSIGMVGGANRMEMVVPLFINTLLDDKDAMCEDAVNSFVNAVIGDLQDCMSSDAYISYLAAEGMRDGLIPFRADYASTTYAGSGDAGLIPPTVACLATFYAASTDLPSGGRMRTRP